ncbi:MAG TPA: DNA methyltransferase [Candidatus Scalindua sp.]|nr:DNA methyltransferase [Candidatus Scalindua sp.]
MKNNLEQYCKNIKQRFRTGISTEHSYRGDLQNLLQNLIKGINITNEPKRQKCGAPDYIIQRKEVPIGYIEAKDIGIDLNKIEKSDQLKRYKKSLDNLILTDYAEFRFIKYGEKVKTIKIIDIENSKLNILSENFESFITHINDFCSFKGQTIKSAEKLAKMMAHKVRMMEEVIHKAVEAEDEDNTLKEQLAAFRRILIHDLSEKQFADIYAQTIAYGLFAARLHDTTLEDFSREEALFLVPKSNPFLRQLFTYVAGPDLDNRVVWIVNDLADIFRATDVKSLLADFGIATQHDPFIHFYETFLAEYDAKLRKSRGVYYTPEPVVNFIVRAVDDILKTEFDLQQGLADTSKIEIKVDVQDIGKKIKKQVHKVQILDPATGTGTFLTEVVKQIYKKFEKQKGIWSNYVENELIPRINGFEILMASYTICHLKLEMLLRETGYKPRDKNKQQRLRVFLTNSLEEAHPDTGTLFASWLSREAKEANLVKRDTPVMVVLGNPPYSVSSTNKSEWIERLMADYKKNLNDRNIQPLSDDYIKFIRYAHHFIEKNGEGILAYISNNSFIDGVIHRQMRKNLLEGFDKVYILDLHGNSKKKEICPDGSQDQNVFDIMQGVSINIFVRTGNKKKNELGKVYHYDLFGKREAKYKALFTESIQTLAWLKITPDTVNHFFVQKDFRKQDEYQANFKVTELFITYSAGIQTKRDGLFIDEQEDSLNRRIQKVLEEEFDDNFIKEFKIKDSSSYKLTQKIKEVEYNQAFVDKVQYRPFDNKYIYYDPNLLGRPFYKTMFHLKQKGNIGLVVSKQFMDSFKYAFISNKICDMNLIASAGAYGAGFSFPLYLYPETNGQTTLNSEQERTPNLNQVIVKQIAAKLGLTFAYEKEEAKDTFAPIDILDYIYAVLHSSAYREKYKEFLKIDFPRIPYPKDKDIFWQLVKLGGELRQIHLLESPRVEQYTTSYPNGGNNIVTRKIGKNDFEIIDKEKCLGRVWINDRQYFDKVPVIAWKFYIGGYQPAQKWLKDRKGRELTFENISHYQKIIVALTETDRLMKEIDKIQFMDLT